MFGKLLKFEISYQSKQIGFWVAIIVMFILGLGTPWLVDVLGSGSAGEKMKVNGSQMIAGQIASWDIAMIFLAAIFTATGILRDKTHNMLQIVHSTPVSTFNMTATRMIGIYLTVLLCIFANTLGIFIGQFLPAVDSEILGPIRPQYYLQPMVIFTVINALTMTALFTLIAGLSQNRMLVYVSAIGFLFLTFMTGMVTELDWPHWLQGLADPFGSIAYTQETEFWSPEDRNERLLPVMNTIGMNRLVWGGAALVILAAVFGKFKRGLINGKTKLEKNDALQIGVVQPYTPLTLSSRA